MLHHEEPLPKGTSSPGGALTKATSGQMESLELSSLASAFVHSHWYHLLYIQMDRSFVLRSCPVSPPPQKAREDGKARCSGPNLSPTYVQPPWGTCLRKGLFRDLAPSDWWAEGHLGTSGTS